MTTIAAIVEGEGDVHALPVLLRRLAQTRGVFDFIIPTPIRVARDRFLRRDEEFRRMLLLASAKAGPGGTVLVLLDADDDCPADLAQESTVRARQILPGANLAVVIANREYEAWFLAAARRLPAGADWFTIWSRRLNQNRSETRKAGSASAFPEVVITRLSTSPP